MGWREGCGMERVGYAVLLIWKLHEKECKFSGRSRFERKEKGGILYFANYLLTRGLDESC